MRSWSLLLSSIFASVVSVLSLVIPFCLFLNFYYGDLFVLASERTAQRGIEVMIYLTPPLILLAWLCYGCIFCLFSAPLKIFEPKTLFKLFSRCGLIWFSLIFFFQFLDGRMAEVQESLRFGLVSFVILAIPLLIGVLSGHFFYLKILKRIAQDKLHSQSQPKYTFLPPPL